MSCSRTGGRARRQSATRNDGVLRRNRRTAGGRMPQPRRPLKRGGRYCRRALWVGAAGPANRRGQEHHLARVRARLRPRSASYWSLCPPIRKCDPNEQKESFRLADAAQNGTFTPELAEEVQRNIPRLKDSGSASKTCRVRATFTTPENLNGKLNQALNEWFELHAECRSARPGKQNPRTYLEWLRDQAATIDIRALGEGARPRS